MAKKSQSYADLLTLKGLKVGKEIKSAFKKGASVGGAYRHVKRTLKRKLGRSEPKESPPSRPYTTTRTEAIEKAVGDVAETKQYRRMKGRKK